ncbi:tau 95 subunit of transcription factor TFIIIC [Ophidiomyces ophidiicola]|uniref:Tau 95 subunit of transcription factor TFIIIC n=1 Tax=Ophidiomyces ophidiicola TaxID=1387563 RepID=A0ACB8V435_9EURO|nr:tau 95 subunit of transcription factor TFIIIC [Ophidiomyces ophidiicola]KAI1952716.1 tau 95 subunit of transcription factor TFIIIC [Ophidiomyces ophidiicola]KAI1954283.1 tau 95 subunit of transcription factor TFIIIC [Ophidiomyces ophidiicola]KAI1975819.1 tau 95 subunit of transcription factor TFIIIC [Ophidiomyces ophidiicola]KAI2012047.1 tau 95 subunit of transcription factor TFIIIC [Ophidiomyces ophidiicola]KAI2030108.1 tau 95 subunit of transcription factor TFIIIC [Ophidiomyces ophidiicol
MASWKGPTTAPWYAIPPREIISVEHPCIIKDVDRGIATLQRGLGIPEILDPTRPNATAALSLNPEDGMSRPMFSTSKPTNNLLLKVTLPKRTGRKRKRGSQEPYVEATCPVNEPSSVEALNARQVLRRLQDNIGRYEVDVVGRIGRTHVFRGIPDFVYSTTASTFMSKFRENILPFEYQKMKQFDLDMRKGATSNVDITPPPSFSHTDLPFQYMYRQNPSVKQSINTSGETTTMNTQRISKVLTHLVPCDIDSVPTQPHEQLPPRESLSSELKDTIRTLEKILDERPAWTRRGLRNQLTSSEQKYALRTAVPYVGYIFRSGPWRDAILKFGYDPRTTPDSRIYQTLMFRLPPGAEQPNIDPSLLETTPPPAVSTAPVSGRRHTVPRRSHVLGDKKAGEKSHLFTGEPPLGRDGKTWMICDIRDPIITQRLSPLTPDAPPPRDTCEIYSLGWYGNVILGTVRAIMRAKIHHILEHNSGYPDDTEFQPLHNFPTHVDTEDEFSKVTVDAKKAGSKCVQLATEIRGTLRSSVVKRPKRNSGGNEPVTSKKGQKRVRWEDEEEVEEVGEEVEEFDREIEDELDVDAEEEDQ